jgi:WD40 repeat protein
VQSIAFSPDGKWLASGGADHAVRLWDPRGRAMTRELQTASPVEAVAFSPDGKLLAVGCYDKTVLLWDVARGETIRKITDLKGEAVTIAFSPDAATLAVAPRNRDGLNGDQVRFWRVADGAEVSLLEDPPNGQSVAFSPDGKLLVVGSSDGSARTFDLATGKKLDEPYIYYYQNWLVFSPDSKTIATAQGDYHTIGMWPALSKNMLRRVRGHKGYVASIAYSPDGSRLVSGSSDKTVRLWDVEAGKQVLQFDGHTDHVNAVAFSPDGKTVASGSWDKTIRLWDATTGAEAGLLDGRCLVRRLLSRWSDARLGRGRSQHSFLECRERRATPFCHRRSRIRHVDRLVAGRQIASLWQLGKHRLPMGRRHRQATASTRRSHGQRERRFVCRWRPATGDWQLGQNGPSLGHCQWQPASNARRSSWFHSRPRDVYRRPPLCVDEFRRDDPHLGPALASGIRAAS